MIGLNDFKRQWAEIGPGALAAVERVGASGRYVLGREVEGEQAVETDVVKQLREQARRQEKIQKATYDLSTGRNK